MKKLAEKDFEEILNNARNVLIQMMKKGSK